MLRCCYVSGWGWVGRGGIKTFMWLAHTRNATLLLRQWLGLDGVGWDNNVHATCVHTCCYAAATSVVGGWVGWVGIITFMWLAYIVRASFASRREWNGVPCLCTPVVSMECGKFPKVQYQVLGAHVKVVLWALSCFKELEFGNGDGTIEIAQTSSVSPATL